MNRPIRSRYFGAIMVLGVPLKFSSLLENKEVMVDETVTFACQMTKPEVNVTWLRDGKPLSLTGERYEKINQDCYFQLVIPKVTVNDSAEYTVKVGELQSTAVLIVNGLYL